MDIENIISRRRSVRTFDGKALSDADAKRILNYAETVDNPFRIPIKWYLLSAAADKLTTPVIIGADSFIAGKMKRVPHAEEAFGYAFEKIVLFAESIGIGSTWIAGTMDRAAFERAIKLEPGEVMPCVSPLGYPAAKMSLRETLMRKGIKADSRADFGALFFEGSFDTPLFFEKAAHLAKPLELVRLAPSAVNKQPWRVVTDGNKVHFYEKRSNGYVDKSGWDIQKIDIGIAMSHFSLGLDECGMKAELLIEDPCIQTPQDTIYIASYILK